MDNSPLNRRMGEGALLQQFTGTATSSAATLTPDNETVAIYLFNASASVTLQYSIDGGDTYMSVLPLGEVDRYYITKSILVKTASGSAAYEIEAAIRQ